MHLQQSRERVVPDLLSDQRFVDGPPTAVKATGQTDAARDCVSRLRNKHQHAFDRSYTSGVTIAVVALRARVSITHSFANSRSVLPPRSVPQTA